METGSCPRCVLLIEDDDGLREAIGAFLEARGYPTLPANDAQRAVELLRHGDVPRPCLVLADLLTMHVDWATFTSALEPEDHLATLPMALVSVRAPGQSAERIKKPIDFELLARIVAEHCCGGEREGGKKTGRRDFVGSGP